MKNYHQAKKIYRLDSYQMGHLFNKLLVLGNSINKNPQKYEVKVEKLKQSLENFVEPEPDWHFDMNDPNVGKKIDHFYRVHGKPVPVQPPAYDVNGELLKYVKKEIEWLSLIKGQIRQESIRLGVEHSIKHATRAIANAEAAMKPAYERIEKENENG